MSRLDAVVIGSGPAGSAVARVLAAGGARVVVLEAGPAAPEHPRSGFAAMAASYRSLGASVVWGSAPVPFVQGRRVGGSSPINGAICWRLPADVYQEWIADDPGLEPALPWSEIERVTNEIEARLGVAPTAADVVGEKDRLMARGADALGLAHRPIRRNVVGCRGSGRCMQGCPSGAKQSVDVTLLADALASGATLDAGVEARALEVRRGRVAAVHATRSDGSSVTYRAPNVFLAASAVQSPALLLASGLRGGPVGQRFQCHPGVSVAGRFPDPVRSWRGATQGHEVTGLRHERLKFETLGFDNGVLAARLDGVGRALAAEVAALAHWTDWGAAVRARSHGRVRLVFGRPVVTWSASPEDARAYRRGASVLAAMMLAAGAESVSLGVAGAPPLRDPRDVDAFARDGSTRARDYQAVITHMFGTCRIGTDPARSVVGPDFVHHQVAGLRVADSSVFPSNTGVNPQIAIMALATICARRALAVFGEARTERAERGPCEGDEARST
jgi:choline dehydrogenase-like flavoprotein